MRVRNRGVLLSPKLPKEFTHPVLIGEGASASVFRVRQRALERWVVIKIIPEKDSVRRKELLKEAMIHAQIHIDCVPQIYDAFEWNKQVCIVMEWIKGSALSSLLESSLSSQSRRSIADMFIRTLASLHASSYAHRDLKPANVIIAPDKGMFLVDFGFAKSIVDPNGSAAITTKGTPAYMAPELWQCGTTIDFMRADIYAAGKILYQILTGDREQTITQDLLHEDPRKRPASGVELLSLWENRIDERSIVPDWYQSASCLTAERLSDKLLVAARQLLYAGRSDEAYQLLVECLEENPENADAIELMGEFGQFTRNRKLHRMLPYGAVAVITLLCTLIGFIIGKKSVQRINVTSITRTNDRQMHVPFKRDVSAEGHIPVSLAPLKGDSLKTDKLSGWFIVHNPPPSGHLYIDAVPLAEAKTLEKNIEIAYGTHTLSWVDTNGMPVWRKKIDIIPFQTKIVPITTAKRK